MKETNLNYIQLRCCSGGTTFCVMFLTLLFVVPFVYGLYLLYMEDTTVFYILVCVCTVAFFAPLFCLISIALYQYLTVVHITPDGITVSYPNKKVWYIDRDEISAMGFFTPRVRDCRMFFCTASAVEVLHFLENHPQMSRRMFGKRKTEKLAASEEGKWKLALAVHMRFCKPRKTLFVYKLSGPLLKEIATVLDFEITNTGCQIGDRL